MTSAVKQFLGRLNRTLRGGVRTGALATATSESFRVTALNDPFADKQLGHCRVEKRIGQGAMSLVYRARQDVTERQVAVKILRAQLSCVPANVKRFQREAKAISRLSHPNLLNVYDVGTTAHGQPYMVMDYIEGKSLDEFIAAESFMHWQRAVNVFVQACSAMQHAHEHNIIHRDLKPENIMLVSTTNGADLVKVVDFGIVKLTDESQALSQKLTQAGEVWGSPVYMSPEQCAGKELDARTDIYSFGTVMYEALTGAQVFTGKRITEIIMKQLNQKPEPFNTARPELQIPLWLERLVLRALEKEPAQRWQTMSELKTALLAGLESSRPTEDVILGAANLGAVNQSAALYCSGPPPGSTPVDPFVNRRLEDKYLIKSVIGEGGMSIVYEAIQEGVGRRVAIKVLKQELVEDEAQVKRFLREAKAISQLSHPNLVAVYDLGTAPTGQPYMVLEFLDGVALSSMIDNMGAIPAERLLPIFIQVCDVMEQAHRQGIIHRDLKPSNIMIVNNAASTDLVKVVDFGILKYDPSLHAHSQKITKTGDICGSPIYMSPEQVLDDTLDARSDIYSLGVVMYEALTGTYLFSGKGITDILEKHVNSTPVAFGKIRPDLDLQPMLEVAIFKCLEKRPKDRFQSMSELKEALATIHRRLYKSHLPSSAGLSAISPGPSVVNAGDRAPHNELQTLSKPSSEIDVRTVRKPTVARKADAMAAQMLAVGAANQKPPQRSLSLPVVAVGAMVIGMLLAFGVFTTFFNKPAATIVQPVKNAAPNGAPTKPRTTSTKSDDASIEPAAVTGSATKAEPPVELTKRTPPPATRRVAKKKASHHTSSLMDEINAAENAFVKHGH